ncbi:MAG: EI24 domain-containing protein [Cypionkella sp.]|nr:EI24 domain-containing protein [Cypionkella sp.]
MSFSFLRALGQMGSGTFLKVIALGMALALALLAAITWAFGLLIFAISPDAFDLPLIGEVDGLAAILSWGGIALMLGLSVFLMIPVATLFSGMFLDEVADAVEARHYPTLPPAKGQGFYEGLRSGINFLGLVIAINVPALILYVVLPFSPLPLFWAINGYLLGREYFALVAARRIDLKAAKALRRAHWGKVWLAGICMAIPLSIPVLNLIIPVLGVATFTHIFHRLQGREVQSDVI